MAIPLKSHCSKISPEEKSEKLLVFEILSIVGLRKEHAKRYPHEFSGGQRQRIAIARALIARPEVVICDEAVSSLDASVQAQVLNLLNDLQEHFGLTYLFISHDLGVVSHMSDRVAVMYLGRIVEYGLRNALFYTPAHPYTKLLLQSVPRRDTGTKETFLQSQNTETSDIPSPISLPKGCPFHPRCPKATPLCTEEPPWHVINGVDIYQTHAVRCHYPL